jgi:hypothetical protein
MRGLGASIVASAALLCVLSVGLAYGISNGEQVKTSGLITARNRDMLTVRTVPSGGRFLASEKAWAIVHPAFAHFCFSD